MFFKTQKQKDEEKKYWQEIAERDKKKWDREAVFRSSAMKWWTLMIWILIFAVTLATYQLIGFFKQVKHKWEEITDKKHGRIL